MRVPVDLVSGVGIEATNLLLLGPVFVRSLNLNCLLKVLSPNKLPLGLGFQHRNLSIDNSTQSTLKSQRTIVVL